MEKCVILNERREMDMLYSGTIISLIATILLGGSIAPYDTASIQEIPTVIIEQEKKYQ